MSDEKRKIRKSGPERDPDIANSEAALKRAGERARARARQVGVPVIVIQDGKVVEDRSHLSE